MKIAVYNQKGEKGADLTVSSIFDVTVSSQSLTQYINYLRCALRNPVANTKDRGAVSGGGRKPWRQKGTGSARAGSSRSPLWIGGGVTFGPSSERNFQKRINGKEKRKVILSVLGDAIREKKMFAVSDLKNEKPKTKDAAGMLDALKAEGKISVILEKDNTATRLSFRNIAGIAVMTPNKLDLFHLLSADKIIASQNAVSELEEVFGPKQEKAVEKQVESKASEEEGKDE
jgi:large subunit ribosomal protein L4